MFPDGFDEQHCRWGGITHHIPTVKNTDAASTVNIVIRWG
jgi:hypothetical protein